jgi:glycosyltransferase involved in cell wall biosynthesis
VILDDHAPSVAGTADGQDLADSQARLERARSRSVFICTPIARHPVRQYTESYAKTLIHLAQLGIRAYVQRVVGNSNLPRARNELVAAFLASDYDDLLFVDDDMGWHPNAVVRLLASDKDLIGAAGCKKVICPDTDPAKWCLRGLNGPIVQDEMGAIEIEAIGTGFVKISRDVFDRLRAAHPEWKRRGWPNMPEKVRAHYYRFFCFDPEDPDEMGEDIGFCREWRRLGGSVWVDPTIKLIHVGEHEYTGDLTALLESLPAERVTEIREMP